MTIKQLITPLLILHKLIIMHSTLIPGKLQLIHGAIIVQPSTAKTGAPVHTFAHGFLPAPYH